MFGSNSEGQLAIGRTNEVLTESPTLINLPCNVQVDQMSLGYRHSMFLAANGKVYGCGLNNSHQLGLGSSNSVSNYMSPVEIETLKGQSIIKVVAGGFSAAIT